MSFLRKNYIPLGFFLLFLFFLLWPKFFNINQEGGSNCMHVKIFGFECPGCGLTRAIYHALHLNIKHAISLNPTVTFVFPILTLEIIYFFNHQVIIKKIKFLSYFLFICSLFFLYIIRVSNYLKL
jgi:hypothetical protein